MLDKTAILAIQDLKTKVIDVPEWGDQVTVRMISGTERNRLNEVASASGTFDMNTFQTTLLAMSLIDASGVRMFTDDEAAQLGGKSAAALKRIFDEVTAFSALKTTSVEEAEGNSAPAQIASSS